MAYQTLAWQDRAVINTKTNTLSHMSNFVLTQVFKGLDKKLRRSCHLHFQVPPYTLAHLSLVIELLRRRFSDRIFAFCPIIRRDFLASEKNSNARRIDC